jgi:hypothetical protein
MDQPQLELLIDFSDILDGGRYSYYQICSPQDYAAEAGFNGNMNTREILNHFNTFGKYAGRCAPVQQ